MITSFTPINSMILLHQINYILYLNIVCQFCAEYKRIEFFTELNTTSPHIRCDIKLASNFPRSINLASHKFSLLAARSLHHAAAQQIFQHSLFWRQFRSYPPSAADQYNKWHSKFLFLTTTTKKNLPFVFTATTHHHLIMVRRCRTKSASFRGFVSISAGWW